MVYVYYLPGSARSLRQSVTLSAGVARKVRTLARARRASASRVIAELVESGLQAQEADRQGPQFPIAIDDIGISDATLVIDDPVGTSGIDVPNRIERIDAKLAFNYEPVRYSIEISHVSFRTSEPHLALNALSGGVSVKDDT